jgi:pimeloyl-ACP methyl ester carboxylesterase
MIEWSEGQVRTGDTNLHYFRSGGARPPLVLVHGLTDHSLYFTRVAEVLARDWDVVAYDARGHGRSSRITTTFDEDTRVADLVSVVDALDLDRPALVGHSMGGGTISLALATHPDLSRGAVLEDPAWWQPPEAERPRWEAWRERYFADWRASLAELQQQPRAEALAQRAADEPTWSAVDVGTSLDGRYAVQLDALGHFARSQVPWRPMVARFACPTLVLIGDDDVPGTVVSRADAEEAARLNPLVRWVQVPGAGHHVKYDRFDDYVAAVTGFLGNLAAPT